MNNKETTVSNLPYITNLFSIRLKNDEIRLSFTAEDTLRQILGSRFEHYHGVVLKEGKWKKLISKLSKKLLLAIELNLNSDYVHKLTIIRTIHHIEELLKEKGNVDIDIIFELFRIAFNLLGEMPSNQKSYHFILNKSFQFGKYRNAIWTHTLQQKVNIIFESAHFEPFNEKYDYKWITEKFYQEFPFKYDKFIEWYKDQFPILYCKLF